MADWQFSRFTLTAPKSRQRVRLAVTVTGARARNPWNLEDRWGGYTMVHVANGDVYLSHSTQATPPYEFQAQVTSSGDAVDPRIAMDPRGVMHLVYARTGNAYHRFSTDEGKTWGDEELAFSGASHPTIAYGVDGGSIRAAYQGGKIVGNRYAPNGASLGADFFFKDDAGADLLVEDDTFHVQEGRESPGRWVLHVVIDGESATSDWASSDGGKTWMRL